MPKKCGHFAGKQLVPAEEMRQKLRAMLAARRDPDFFVVARTDAMGVTDLDDAIARLESYAAVGADGLYVDAPRSVEQLAEISRRLKPLGLPLLFNMVRSGKSPYLTLREVYELGFDYALCPVEPMLAMHKAVKEMMETFMREGCSTNAIADRLTPFEEFNDFIGLRDVRRAREALRLLRRWPSSHVERRGRVAVLTLHRPEHGNRLTTPLAREVVAALAAARDDRDDRRVRADGRRRRVLPRRRLARRRARRPQAATTTRERWSRWTTRWPGSASR